MKRRLFSILLSLAMVVGLLPTTALAADEVDMSTYTGKRITHVEFTAYYYEAADATKYTEDSYAKSRDIEEGDYIYPYRIQFIPTSLTWKQGSASGTITVKGIDDTDWLAAMANPSKRGVIWDSDGNTFPVYTWTSGCVVEWQNGTWSNGVPKWVSADSPDIDYYEKGEYRYRLSFGVPNALINDYRIDPNVTATVTWYNSDVARENFTLNPVTGRGIRNDNHCSEAGFFSTSFTSRSASRLKLTTVYIPDGRVDEVIEPFSLTERTYGGTAPYRYEKVHGPDWVKVDADGKVYGTRPSTEADKEWLRIKVTDANGDTDERGGYVGKTILEYREIKTVELGSLYYPHVGDDAETNQAHIISLKDTNGNTIPLNESALHVSAIMSSWRVKNGKNWERFEGVFEEGKEYRYSVQLRIDGEENREKFGLAEDLTVTLQGLDGVTLERRTVYSESTYACTYVHSSPMTPLAAATELTGSISYVGAARFHEPLNARVTANTGNYKVQWQYLDGKWYELNSGTSITLNAGSSWLKGRLIRAVAYSTDPNYSGTIYGAALTVEKGWNMGIPVQPEVEIDPNASYYIHVKDALQKDDQEYCWTDTPSKDPTTGSAVWPETCLSDRAYLFRGSLTPGQTYYVYTRFKETDTKEAGRILGVAMYTVPTVSGDGSTATNLTATDLRYPAYDSKTPTIYLEKGKSITVEYQLAPNNADQNLPRWNGTYDQSGAQVTVNNDAENKTLTITAGSATGTVTVTAYKQAENTPWYYGTDYSAAGRTITVKIYDPKDLSTVPFPSSVDLGEVTLYVGDTYTVDRTAMKDALDLPAGVDKSGYHFSAYVKTGDVMTGAPNVGTTAQDGSVTMAGPVITAEKAGSATVYVFARTDETVPTNAGQGGCFAHFTVTVNPRPTLLDFSIAPPALTLQAGNAYQLTAAKTPSDAAGSVTWSSSNAAVATVDSTGKVTAVTTGTATITADCGDAKATCTVTVLAGCDGTHAYFYQEKDWGHEKLCGLCGYSDGQVLAHELYWQETTGGKMYGKCTLCGYTTDLEDIPAPGEGVPSDKPSTPSGFVDVPADAYYAEAVQWAAEKSISGGMDATHFAPDLTCTRAQAVTFLWRAAGCPAPTSTETPFADVKAGSYYYEAVLWAVENDITKGTSATKFSPDLECSRAQIVTFLWRSQGSPAVTAENPFADVKADAYYADAVLWAVQQDITKGTSATKFSPDLDCTRAQIVTFIYRCMK